MSKTIHPVDVHVGQRVQKRRKSQGLSQTALAKALGLTFQQVQKYESGANRISASKLWETARFLQTPLEYFFEGLDGDTDPVTRFMMSDDGQAIAKAMIDLDEGTRRKIKDFVGSLADQSSKSS